MTTVVENKIDRRTDLLYVDTWNLVPVWRQAIASFLFYENTILLNSIVLKYDTKNFKKFKIAIDNKTFYMLL